MSIILAYMEKMRRDMHSVKADAREARTQTRNSHSTNLRDDLDGKHEETLQLFEKQEDHNKEVLKLIGGLERSNTDQWNLLNDLRRKVDKRKWL